MKIYRIGSFEEFQAYRYATRADYERHFRTLYAAIPTEPRPFTLRGYSYPAQREVDFECDFLYSSGYPAVNWRERVVCPITGLNNRLRAAIHLYDLFSNTLPGDPVFIMEQISPLHAYLKNANPGLIGAEYLGDAVPLGQTDERGIRNEDACRLTFADGSLKAILSFDILEHIYNYRQALAECHRALVPGGSLFLSVPFIQDSEDHLERATRSASGEIIHLEPPEYHGDPLNRDGILCYRHFGWRLLDELRQTGFSEAVVCIFNDLSLGHCTNQTIFYCRK